MRAFACSGLAAGLVVGLAHLAAGGASRPSVGVIRWDAWGGKDGVEGGEQTRVLENTLKPPKYWHRLPWFAQVRPDGTVSLDGAAAGVMEREIDYAADAGLDYFIFLDYGRKSFKSRALERFLRAGNSERMKFAVCFMLLPSIVSDEDWRETVAKFVPLLRHPQWLKVCGGRPLTFVFRGDCDSKRHEERLRLLFDAVRADGGERPYLVAFDPAPRGTWGKWPAYEKLGYDAVGSYASFGRFSGGKARYDDFVRSGCEDLQGRAVELGACCIPGFMTGWQKDPRKDFVPYWEKTQSYHKQKAFPDLPTPDQIAAALRDTLDFVADHPTNCPANAIAVYAWNEHDEGGWLCPTWTPSGVPDTSRLDAVRRILRDEAGSAAVTSEWKLGPNCVREGNVLRLCVENPQTNVSAVAQTTMDVSALAGRWVEARVRLKCRMETPFSRNGKGVRMLFNFKEKGTGAQTWPEARLSGWTTGAVERAELYAHFKVPDGGTVDGRVTLYIGLQEAVGSVAFDLDTLRFGATDPLSPRCNGDLRCRYTADVQAAHRARGVMSPSRPMTEDDFRTLADWGATLLRYQMVGDDYAGTYQDLDLVKYDSWLERKLDHLRQTVLPLAQRYGIRVVVDLHSLPGGRVDGGDWRVYYDARYARRFVEIWGQIARRFKGNGTIYGYDLSNEPIQRRFAVRGCDFWTLQVAAAKAIRAADPTVPIIVETNRFASPEAIADFSPIDLTNIVYQVHMYAPGEFTHQGVRGAPIDRENLRYPDAKRGWNPGYLRHELEPVRRFQQEHGARIYVGEFSAIAWANGAENYLRDCIAVFEDYGWDWSYHAFRESSVWSVEHEGLDRGQLRPAKDTPRQRVLVDAFRRD